MVAVSSIPVACMAANNRAMMMDGLPASSSQMYF